MTVGVNAIELDTLEGGQIGAFFDFNGDGTFTCIGVETISTGFFGLALWGDDSSTPEIDGLPCGEWPTFAVLLDTIVELIDVTDNSSYYLPETLHSCGTEGTSYYCEYYGAGYCTNSITMVTSILDVVICEYDSDNDGVCDEDEITGCTEIWAENYNVLATESDSSCYLSGCMDSVSCLYNQFATFDDGSCDLYTIFNVAMYDSYGDGWTGAVLSINDESITLVSGSEGYEQICVQSIDSLCFAVSCIEGSYASEVSWVISDSIGNTILSGGAPFEDVIQNGACQVEYLGCTDTLALNYESFVSIDDSSCAYIPDLGTLECGVTLEQSGTTTSTYGFENSVYYSFSVDTASEVILSLDGFSSMSDPYVLLFDSTETYLQTISYTQSYYINEASLDLDSGQYYMVVTEDHPSFYGGNIQDYYSAMLTNSQSMGSFTLSLLTYDGSCDYLGCTVDSALNYNSYATLDDGSCILPIYGCLDQNYSEFDTLANIDTGGFCITPTVLVSSCQNIILDSLLHNVFDDVQISNITYSNSYCTIGEFNGSYSNLGLCSGLEMNVAGIDLVAPPSTGDTDLSYQLNIANAPSDSTNSAVIIEFDFVATEPVFDFTYVFASNEYGSYACSQYTDIFAAFISGPGIAGPYSNNAENIAVVPNPDSLGLYTQTPITPSTITSGDIYQVQYPEICAAMDSNWQDYSVFYVENNDTTVTFPAFTIPLTAESIVIPGITYHLKLAIANASDNGFSPSVFIQSQAAVNENICSIYGCTDSLYVEYLEFANIDDESCENLILYGCTDEAACNYNTNATNEDNSCVFINGICETCENGYIVDNDSDNDGVCDADEVSGCQDEIACNYMEFATDSLGNCIYSTDLDACAICSGETDGTGVIVDNDADNNGVCDTPDITVYAPDSLVYSISVGDTISEFITICNEGENLLELTYLTQNFSSIIFSEQFYQGQEPISSIVEEWDFFLEELNNQDVYTSVNLSGSFDEIGRTCTDPDIVNQIASSLANFTYGSFYCDGYYWTVDVCDNLDYYYELNVGNVSESCTSNSNYAVRPGIHNHNWGGVNTVTVFGPSQVITLEFTIEEPTLVSLIPTTCDTLIIGDINIDIGQNNFEIIISSNDPDEPEIIIPVAIFVDIYDESGICINDEDLDGICDEIEIEGCVDSTAFNFYVDATEDDGSCELPTDLESLECGVTLEQSGATTSNYGFENSVYYSFSVDTALELILNLDGYSSMYDPYVLLFDSTQTYMQTIYYTSNYYINEYSLELDSGAYYMVVTEDNPSFYGGTLQDYYSAMETNYQSTGSFTLSLVTYDGSCDYPGCMDSTAFNFNTAATIDDGSCDYPTVLGSLECGVSLSTSLDTISAHGYESIDNPQSFEAYTFTLDSSSTVELSYEMNVWDCSYSCYSQAYILLFENDILVNIWTHYEETGGGYTSGDIPSEIDLAAGSYTLVYGNYGYDMYINEGMTINEVTPQFSTSSNDNEHFTFQLEMISYDGSCDYPGCMDADALNFNPIASVDDGSCEYPEFIECGDLLYGSTSGQISNYGSSASPEDLYYFELTYSADIEFSTCNSSYDTWIRIYQDDLSNEIYSCDDCGPCGVQTVAEIYLEPGNYILLIEGYSNSEGDYEITMNCVSDELLGCTDATAYNYDYSATEDDGSCYPFIYGCMWDLADNYTALTGDVLTDVNTDDGSCYRYGCTYEWAVNYDSLATTDDGTCIAPIYGCTDSTAFNFNPIANTNDGSCIEYVYGCMDTSAFNYNSEANTDDDSCEYSCELPSSWEHELTGVNQTLMIPADISVEVNGAPIPLGSTIGVFYTNEFGVLQCAGYTSINGEITFIAVMGDDSTTDEIDGLQVGEDLVWMAWDISTCEQYELNAEYSSGSTTFTPNGVTFLESLDQYTCQQVVLPGGWFLYSSYIQADDMDAELVMNSIVDNLVILKDNDGNAYLTEWAFNGVGELDFRQGYQIKTNSPDTLEICGLQKQPQENPIPLSEGWNIVSYLREVPASAGVVLEDLNSNDNLLIVKDYSGNPYLPEWDYNGIGDMHPGQGYQLKVENADTLTYLSNDIEYRVSSSIVTKNDLRYFPKMISTGNNMQIVIPEDVLSLDIELGAEIAAYNSDGLLVGSTVYSNPTTVLTVWGDDATTRVLDGLQIDEQIVFKVWDKEQLRGLRIENWAAGSNEYQVDAVYVADAVQIEQSANLSTLFEAIPNPSYTLTTISFYIPTANKVNISVYNVIGELVETITDTDFEVGLHSFEMNVTHLEAGSYFYTMTSDDYLQTKQLVILK